MVIKSKQVSISSIDKMQDVYRSFFRGKLSHSGVNSPLQLDDKASFFDELRNEWPIVRSSLSAKSDISTSSEASEEAERLGLSALGFGRYYDHTTRDSYVTENGKLKKLPPYKQRKKEYDRLKEAKRKKRLVRHA